MTSKTFNVGSLSFAVDIENPEVNPPSKVGRLYTKEHRPDIGSKEEKELISSITSKQYDKYEMMNISLKDAANLKNNLSLTQRLKLTRSCWERYDLLDPCNIVFPKADKPAVLEIEGNAAKFRDIFTNHRQLTVTQVAKSCEYYHKYVRFNLPNDKGTSTLAKELAWSYNHFQKHVDAKLYDTVDAEFQYFSEYEQGGPLFLKLLLDQLVVSSEASLDTLILTTTTYDIKKEHPEEDIIEVCKVLSSMTDTIVSIRDDTDHPLPEKYIQKMIQVFQTTSVEPFNDGFKKLESDLVFNRRYKKTATSTALMSAGGVFSPGLIASQFQLDNDPRSATFLWTFALETYKEMKENGKWDHAVRTPGQSTFVSGTSTSTIRCWNCDGEHNYLDCDKPIDEARVDENRQAFAKRRRTTRRRPYAWRPPSEDEAGKRVIYNKPHTWDPTRKRWQEDETPDAGLTVNTRGAALICPPCVPTDDDTVATGASSIATSIPTADFNQFQVDLANLVNAAQRWS
jgi:hypothetical protein